MAAMTSPELGPEFDEGRARAVQRVLVVEGCANLAMFSAKLSVGLATGSTVILGDALHSLTDLANNGVAVLAQRISSSPPDEDHPYGHRKYEQLAVFALAGLLTVMAFELCLRATQRFDVPVDQSGGGLIVMCLVLATNCTLAVWENRRARELDSALLWADARHTAGDVATTVVVIVGWQVASSGYAWVDPLTAIAVALFVLYLAFGLFRSAIPILVDHAVTTADQLRSVISEIEHVSQVRRVRSRSDGRRSSADIVVAIENGLSVEQAHLVADEIERALAEEFDIRDVSVHVEPL
jgi:cation diffusion facilitator family transporter